MVKHFISLTSCVAFFYLFLGLPVATAGQPLETESARFLKQGEAEVEFIYEFQTSSGGTEHAVPVAFEYGILDRLRFLFEPVLYTGILPSSGKGAHGFGDTETTLAYLLKEESQGMPAVAFAAEAKIPTARKTLIGTGGADYAGYFIGSKRLGDFDLHLNAGYTIVGQPAEPSAHLSNTYNFAFASEYFVTTNTALLAEILINTASSNQDNEGTAISSSTPLTPEAGGGEVIGMIGARYFPKPHFGVGLGLNYDNNSAFLVRAGITLTFN